MKTIILLMLSALTFQCSAQKIRFTDSRNEWITLSCVFDSPPSKNAFKYYTDTVAFGRTYKSIHNTESYYYCKSWTGDACPGIPVWQPESFLVREDTISGKVYFISLTSTDTNEHLLYDYNAAVGDTLKIGSFVDTVTNVDSMVINGVYHKFLSMHGHGRDYFVLEGVGCTNGPLFPAYFGGCSEYGESLSCFSQAGIHPVIQTLPIGLCGAFVTICCQYLSLDSFDNSARCAKVLSEKNIVNDPFLTIKPNPASDYIDIISNTELNNNANVSVYNITGQCIFRSGTELRGSLSINTSAWCNGMYFIVIQNSLGILKKEKIIISR